MLSGRVLTFIGCGQTGKGAGAMSATMSDRNISEIFLYELIKDEAKVHHGIVLHSQSFWVSDV